MKETGRILKETRESQNISLAAVSAVTKINIKILEAIENANMENLPSKTFLRGFVQTYAQFLKLAPNDVLDLFQKEMGTTKYTPVVNVPIDENQTVEKTDLMEVKSEAATPPPAPKVKSDDEGLAFANGGRSIASKLIFAALAALLIAGIYIVSQVVQKYQKESQLPEPSPDIQSNALPEESKDSAATTTTAPPSEKVTEAADTNKAPSTEQKPAAHAETAAPAKTTETKTAATETKAPEKPVEKQPAKSAEPAVAPPVEQKPATPPTATTASLQEITVEALDSVKIDYRVDGGALESVTLQPEEKKTFKAKRELKMDVSNGGAVSINQNGRDRGVPGNLGQPMKLSFP